jgi:hypothetical protein
MVWMRFLVRLVPPVGSKEATLNTIKSVAKNVGVDAKNPKWTSQGALELDIFSKSKEDFLLFLSVAEPLAKLDFSRDLNEAPRFRTREQLFHEAKEYFNAERYWECHEVLEAIWRTVAGDEKLFAQGIILVCAAFVHHQKAEQEVALGVLERGARQLGWREETYHGIVVATLRRNVERVLKTREFTSFRI